MKKPDADIQALGRRIAKYGSQFSGLGGLLSITVVVVMLLGGTAGIIAAIMWLLELIQQKANYTHIPILCIVFAGIFAIIGADQMYIAILNERITLYEGGIVYQTSLDTLVIPWEHIAAVWFYRSLRGTFFVYNLELKDRTRLKLYSYSLKNLGKVGGLIEKTVSELLLPQYVERLKAGESVNFGRLSLSQRGINDNGQEIPWENIREVRFHAGYLRISQAGKWRKRIINSSEIDNLPAFLTIVDQFVGVQTGFSF